jgi:hypothetical protein
MWHSHGHSAQSISELVLCVTETRGKGSICKAWVVSVCAIAWLSHSLSYLPPISVGCPFAFVIVSVDEARHTFRHICNISFFGGQSSWLNNGDVLCFLWGTNSIYICYVEESRPPLWSSGQSSWLQNEYVLCLLWGTNWSYICYVEESRPPLWSSDQSSWLHNGDVLCFLWGTNSIYICYVEESRPPLWSSRLSSWLQIQRSGFDSLRYQIFWEVVDLERGPLSLVSTTEELLWRNSRGSGLESREYGRGYP